MKVLIVEDEPLMARAMASYLRRYSAWEVDIASDGTKAMNLFEKGGYHVAMIDWWLPAPGPDGIALCRRFRERSKTMGIIMVTVRDALEDKLEAFEAGADDYLVKPFDGSELAARAKAVVRRSWPSDSESDDAEGSDAARTQGAALVLDPIHSTVRGPLGTVELSRTELKIMQRLVATGSKAQGSKRIAAMVLRRRDDSSVDSVHRHMSNLRVKLAKVGLEDYIVRSSVGYALKR